MGKLNLEKIQKLKKISLEEYAKFLEGYRKIYFKQYLRKALL